MLSAEPLVGLKQSYSHRDTAVRPAFSRTPRGFEAYGRLSVGQKSACFQPNPSWV